MRENGSAEAPTRAQGRVSLQFREIGPEEVSGLEWIEIPTRADQVFASRILCRWWNLNRSFCVIGRGHIAPHPFHALQILIPIRRGRGGGRGCTIALFKDVLRMLV